MAIRGIGWRLGDGLREGIFVSILSAGRRVARVLRLVKTRADGEKQFMDVVKINRPGDLVNIANSGITAAEGNLLLAGQLW